MERDTNRQQAMPDDEQNPQQERESDSQQVRQDVEQHAEQEEEMSREKLTRIYLEDMKVKDGTIRKLEDEMPSKY